MTVIDFAATCHKDVQCEVVDCKIYFNTCADVSYGSHFLTVSLLSQLGAGLALLCIARVTKRTRNIPDSRVAQTEATLKVQAVNFNKRENFDKSRFQSQ